MNKGTIVVHVDSDRRQYFLSTDHCQGVRPGNKDKHPKSFTPITWAIPHSVAPRPELPSGRIESKEDLFKVYFVGYQEIPNPDPAFQPKE
jgi:hypothetical protein